MFKPNAEYNQRAAIIESLRAGRSATEIIQFFGYPRSTVNDVVTKYESEMSSEGSATPPLIVERHTETNTSNHMNDTENTDGFTSQYLRDFEPVGYLGKGGFGVVFEAKKKMDDYNYAIKRITLPYSQSSRDHILREVKALAKLDHPNIVRYFNSWFEDPPAGWQEKHDPEWMRSDGTSTGTKSSIESASEEYDALNHCDSEEDSVVVFKSSDSHKPNENVMDMSKCSTESSNLSVSNDAGEEIMPSIEDGTRSQSTASPKMFLYIQMELCRKLSLREWLKNSSKSDILRPLHVTDWFWQIVEGVEWIHLHKLIHRDLKPSNIFFSSNGVIKVGDFGLVTAMTEGYGEDHTQNNLHTTGVGTRLYMSPEQIKGLDYNYKVDVYSVGVILFELLIPFTTEMERVTALMNLRKLVFPEDFHTKHSLAYALLELMLDEDPSRRPTMLYVKANSGPNFKVAKGLTRADYLYMGNGPDDEAEGLRPFYRELPRFLPDSPATSRPMNDILGWQESNFGFH